MPGHVKSTLIGASVNIPITNGKFNLGTWQGKKEALELEVNRIVASNNVLEFAADCRHLLVRAPQRGRVGLRPPAQGRRDYSRLYGLGNVCGSARTTITGYGDVPESLKNSPPSTTTVQRSSILYNKYACRAFYTASCGLSAQ
jgi:hypothetical protein